MDREKYLLLLPYTYIPSISTVDLLLHLQHYKRGGEPMVLKMCVKSKFVLCQPRCYILLTEKKFKKIHVFEALLFWRRTATLNLQKFSWNTIFALSNPIILVKDLRTGNRGSKIFLSDHHDDEIGNKNIAGKY